MATSLVSWEPILTVPVEEFTSDFHSFDMLTQMGVRLEQHEGGVGGEDDGICGVSILAAAVIYFCVPVKPTVRHLAADRVVVPYMLVIPFDPSRIETYGYNYGVEILLPYRANSGLVESY